jgi:hypothetical protein
LGECLVELPSSRLRDGRMQQSRRTHDRRVNRWPPKHWVGLVHSQNVDFWHATTVTLPTDSDHGARHQTPAQSRTLICRWASLILKVVVVTISLQDVDDQHLLVLFKSMSPSVMKSAFPVRGVLVGQEAPTKSKAAIPGGSACLLDRKPEEQRYTRRTTHGATRDHRGTVAARIFICRERCGRERRGGEHAALSLSELRQSCRMGGRPLLFMDVDGVLALWDPVVDVERVRLVGAAGVAVLVPAGTAGRLHQLAACFEMVWATAWGSDAPEFLGPRLGVGAEWPVLDFDLYKWAAVCDHAEGRPFAWVDDEARGDEVDVHEHASASHVIVHTDHRIGLDDEAVVRLLTFAGPS